MLTATQTAALKRVTKKLSAMRKALPKAEREMLDSLIIGSTPEVKGHRASVAQARAEVPAKKISKRSIGARAEVEGHMADWRLGAMKDQGMLKDAGAVREGGMAKDSAAAEVQGHRMNIQAAAQNAAQSSVASMVREAVSFSAALSAYVVSDK